MDLPAQRQGRTGLRPVQYDVRLSWPDGSVVLEGEDAVRLRRLTLDEEIGRPFRAQMVVLVAEGTAEAAELVGAQVRLAWGRLASERVITGVVLATATGETRQGWTTIDLDVGPALSLLSLTRRSRVWQDRSVPEIVELVAAETLGERGAVVDGGQLRGEYPSLDYCVQYRETDLDFVHRLLEAAGIGYRFEPRGDAEAVVLTDDNAAAPHADGSASLWIERGPLGGSARERLSEFGWHRRLHPRRVVMADWDWRTAEPVSVVHEAPEAEAAFVDRHELHDLQRPLETEPGGMLRDTGAERAQLELQRIAGAGARGRGRSDACALAAGHVVAVHDPDDRVDGGLCLLTRVVHRADVPGAEPDGQAKAPHYDNRIECIPADVPFRPALRTPKPVVAGPHTAVVIGPPGEEIHTDEAGRIQVVMHWDREWFMRGAAPSCWLRTVQAWAGAGHGALFTPRVGMEVVVAFLDGDPDRPICTGCVYNGQNVPPQCLPEHKSRSTIRTASVGGGEDCEGFNELTFEDAAGREEVYVHAQRNLRETVRSCQRTSVGADQSLSVGRDRTKTVSGCETAKVEGDRNDEVLGNATEVVAGSQDITIMGTSQVGGVHGARLYVGGTYTIEAEQCIRLQCGGSTLELTPDGVRIYALQVHVHGGPSSAHLLPTGVQVQGPEATIVGGRSVVRLGEGAEVGGGTFAEVRQGDSHLRLDGNATLTGATAAVRGTAAAELVGSTCTVKGDTTGVSGLAVHIAGEQATVLEGGGTKTTMASGRIEME